MVASWLILAAIGGITQVDAGFITTKLGPHPIWNLTLTDKLRQDLLLNYDKFARPAQHYNVTKVELGLSILHVEVNEFRSTLTVHVFLRMLWTDEKLKWDPPKYGGLTMVHLADHEIWQPDVFLYNSYTAPPIGHYGNTHCIVYNTGQVFWAPPAQFTVICEFNFKYWPFDTQQCYLRFGSWTYSGDQIELGVYGNGTDPTTELLIESNEWKIQNTSMELNTKYYSCCPEPYYNIDVNITISRISPSYKTIIVAPAFVIAVLVLLSFWLPPDAGEKILLNCCTTIVICIFMFYFSQKLPSMGNNTPLIVLFYSSCLYIVVFSMIGSVIVINIAKMKHNKHLPWILKKPLTGTLGKVLGLEAYIRESSVSTTRVTAEEMRDHQVTEFDDVIGGDEHHIIRSATISNKSYIQQDWILLAAAIDRISFCFYAFLFAVLAIVYSL